MANTVAISQVGGVIGGAGSANATYQPVTLTTGANTITATPSSPSTGDILLLRLTEPAGGGATITWSGFTGVTSADHDNTPSAKNRYVFMWDGSAWDLWAMTLGK